VFGGILKRCGHEKTGYAERTSFFEDIANFIVMIVIDLVSDRNTGRYGMTIGMTKAG
jgi:hypothetical protein